jgi:hypothetical protein
MSTVEGASDVVLDEPPTEPDEPEMSEAEALAAYEAEVEAEVEKRLAAKLAAKEAEAAAQAKDAKIAQLEAELKEEKEKKAPKEKLSADPLGNRGPSKVPNDGRIRATRANLNDLNWMQAHAGKLSDFELID